MKTGARNKSVSGAWVGAHVPVPTRRRSMHQSLDLKMLLAGLSGHESEPPRADPASSFERRLDMAPARIAEATAAEPITFSRKISILRLHEGMGRIVRGIPESRDWGGGLPRAITTGPIGRMQAARPRPVTILIGKSMPQTRSGGGLYRSGRSGAGGEDRTPDLRFTKPLHYRCATPADPRRLR